ncbi:hypothetical protein ABZP36_013785 [Zizania latifolia]
MPPLSLLSLLTAMISPRLLIHRTRGPSLLHASSSSSNSREGDELNLLEKSFPSPSAIEEHSEADPEPTLALSTEEVPVPFLKFLQVKSAQPDKDAAMDGRCMEEDADEGEEEERARAGTSGSGVIYYDPKPRNLAVGVVVNGDGRTLDIDVSTGGKTMMMMPKEACNVSSKDAIQFTTEGKVGVVVSGEEGQGEMTGGRNRKGKGSPVLGIGTVVFVEVLSRTLRGRPLLSTRRLFQRIAWHKVRQGLRAFLPKPEMMTRPRNFTDLKNSVRQQIHVCITRIDERSNGLIISEKEAWAMTYLREGALLQGTVRKLFPYGAQIRIGETNRGGLLHISNITHGQLASVGDVLKVGEIVKAIVIKSTAPDRIALSTKDLESEPGLFISKKERVFSDAEEMAQRYRDQISETAQPAEFDSSCDNHSSKPSHMEYISHAYERLRVLYGLHILPDSDEVET